MQHAQVSLSTQTISCCLKLKISCLPYFQKHYSAKSSVGKCGSTTTLKWQKLQLRVEGEFTEEFDVHRGVRQGDVLSTILINLSLEKAVSQIAYKPKGHDI